MTVGGTELRDLELVLLGVLPSGHLLGGPLCTRGDGSVVAAADDAPNVSVRLPADVAQRALRCGSVLLRDDEHTPLARLVGLVAEQPLAGTGAGIVLSGRLVVERAREGGISRGSALSQKDLASRLLVAADERPSVVVLGRPPLRADEEALRVAAAAPGPLVVLVPDDLAAPVSLRSMLRVARQWVAGLPTPRRRVVIRSAPISWRDEASDRELVHRLGGALGAGTVVTLAPSDDLPEWAELRSRLRTGAAAGNDLVEPGIGAELESWRPPRPRRGLVLMFSGLSGSGKSTLARDLAEWLQEHTERTVTLLDGDVVRTMLSSGLGFDRAARELNVLRIGFVASEVARHGGVAICSPIAPFASARDAVREMASAVGDFVLVHVDTPLAECERRDLKGLYARARAGQVAEFTGISSPYEVPEDADLRIDTSVTSRDEALGELVAHLVAHGWIAAEPV